MAGTFVVSKAAIPDDLDVALAQLVGLEQRLQERECSASGDRPNSLAAQLRDASNGILVETDDGGGILGAVYGDGDNIETFTPCDEHISGSCDPELIVACRDKRRGVAAPRGAKHFHSQALRSVHSLFDRHQLRNVLLAGNE